MVENSKIEWTDHTFNPWIGCEKVSTGCKYCYAEALMDLRYGKVEWGKDGERKRTSPDNWKKPLKWNREAHEKGIRYRVFCSSLADVFENRPELIPWRKSLFELIHITPDLDWLLLTKRPQNVLPYTQTLIDGSWPENIWVGTSVENQQTADERIPFLLEIPSRIRFLSYEPALGPVDFYEACPPDYELFEEFTSGMEGWDRPEELIPENEQECDAINFSSELVISREFQEWEVDREHLAQKLAFREGIQWVICGGESGSNARPIHPDWARSARDQCRENGVAYFFKQWGEWLPFNQRGELVRTWKAASAHTLQPLEGGVAPFVPGPDQPDEELGLTCSELDGNDYAAACGRVGKKKAGRELDGQRWDQFPTDQPEPVDLDQCGSCNKMFEQGSELWHCSQCGELLCPDCFAPFGQAPPECVPCAMKGGGK